MHLRLPLAAALTLSAAAASADPFALHFTAPAVEIGLHSENPARYALAIAAFDGTKVPSLTIAGQLDQHAFRLDGLKDNTLALIQPLQDQVEQAGYKVLFACATTDCGGFDFRFAIDVLPEPRMHVDLGDFRYLAARNAAGDVISVLASRSADQGFVQVTTVSVEAAAAATTDPAKPSLAAAPDVMGATSPAPAPPDTSATPATAATNAAPTTNTQPAPRANSSAASLDDQLMAQGSVALDDLIFASGKAALLDQDYASLAALADWLKAHPDLKVTLVGHTDATGSLASNVALSKARAASVRAWLIKHYAATAAQIDAQGAGYLAPRATNQTPEGRLQNRRVEVMLTSTPAK